MIKQQSLYLSILSGIFLSLPWIFPNMAIILLIAFVPLFFAEVSQREKGDQKQIPFFVFAFIAFLVWNVLSTWWIGYVSVPGMLLISVLNAMLMAAVFNLVYRVRGRLSVSSGYFSLIVFWISFEYLQHHWALPWPWLTLGNGFANAVRLVQWYEFTGVLGGSIWILLSNILIFELIKSFSGSNVRKNAKLSSVVAVIVFLPTLLSLAIYFSFSPEGAKKNVLIIQPNIDPYAEKFSGMSPEEQLDRIVSLVKSNVSDSTDLIIAPETALPVMWEDSLTEPNSSLAPIHKIVCEFPNVAFMSGAMTQRRLLKTEIISETARQTADSSYFFDLYNSALFVDQKNKVQISHKSILVNGVEKMPFQKYTSFLEKYLLHLGGASGSLASGEPVLFLAKGGVKIGPVICFESVFGEYCSRIVNQGANFLVVLTNDGWWKESAGSWQHFGYARIRAIETRRNVIQCANTGISGIINSRGDVVKKTGINEISALNSSVRLNTQISFYTQSGGIVGKICLLFAVLILVFQKVVARLEKGKKNPH